MGLLVTLRPQRGHFSMVDHIPNMTHNEKSVAASLSCSGKTTTKAMMAHKLANRRQISFTPTEIPRELSLTRSA